MANFDYEASYEGKWMGVNLSGDIVNSIEKARTSDLIQLQDYDKPGYDKVYRVTLNDSDIVLFALKSNPAKVEGTERVRIHFSGLEESILKVKNELIKGVKNLSLK
ncbi:MAG TPA: hypothetical protein VJH92_05540 [Candidatus Nanoarchaeia archaeon]|nr:hypothetical protein [Candidatus Nanoarchaeia archaeon]